MYDAMLRCRAISVPSVGITVVLLLSAYATIMFPTNTLVVFTAGSFSSVAFIILWAMLKFIIPPYIMFYKALESGNPYVSGQSRAMNELLEATYIYGANPEEGANIMLVSMLSKTNTN